MWNCFQDHFVSRTVSNCRQVPKQKPSAAAEAKPRNEDVEMAGGGDGGEMSGEARGEDVNA